MKNYSIFYHHLKKIKAEIAYYYRLVTRNKKDAEGQGGGQGEIWKGFEKELLSVYKECCEDLDKISGESQFIATSNEIAVVMLNIRI